MVEGERPPLALLLENSGNQMDVYVDGFLVARLGELSNPHLDASKAFHLVSLPAAARPGQVPHDLRLVATMQRQRGGGLGPVRFGYAADLAEVQRSHQRWRGTAAAFYAAGLLLMGGLSAGLWLRQRDELYGCFSLAALSGAVRNLDRAWIDVPVPWPLWGAIVAVSYAVHIALIVRFVFLVLELRPRWLIATLYACLAGAVLLACISFARGQPALWTSALLLLQLVSMACVPVVVQEALRKKTVVAWALLLAGTLAVAAGAHDLLLIRMGLAGGATFALTPTAMFLFVVILGALVVDRYSRTVRDYRQLNATLKDQVAERETQLRGAFELLRQQQEEQAVLLERQRMMREIHDGVGSQLVGLLNVVSKTVPDRAELHDHVQMALDEMRMAVDSLQPDHDDLATVLATLRYRLQGRLDAAGIALRWDVDGLPSVAVTAEEALQVQRILQEAFANVLKHAAARQIVVSAGVDPTDLGRVRIEITDDGSGFSDHGSIGRGHGVANMRWRASRVGGELKIHSAPQRGTHLVFSLPTRRPGSR
ncbi:ATP-binding protein [Variovorax sp. J22R115]|uniref:sensor histidine kinase n=1 Tax=Variovorax sp. J22R115 TaxID=3053509 RepID=UPI002576D858|nr:ATP-binding protein [Variovorax sp. J22R115]MDM0053026.1 ATP-binding protein [Variovorax sp. J22R115]